MKEKFSSKNGHQLYESNQMILCKELILIRDQPQDREDPSEPHLYVVSITASPLWFLQPLCVWSLLLYLCPFLSLCPALSSRIKHNAFSKEQLLASPSLTGSQTWVFSSTMVEDWHSGTAYTTPFNG